MKEDPTNPLAIVGGGYDHLAPVTRAGATALAGAGLILPYGCIRPEGILRLSPGARLLPWNSVDELMALLEDPPRSGAAVLLGDGVACPRLLGRLTGLLAEGRPVAYHPALPLAEAALRRAGYHEAGKASVRMVIPEEGGGLRSLPRESDHRGVIFDGRVLWPARRMPPGGPKALLDLVPPGGVLFIVSPLTGATPDLRPPLAGRGVVVTRAPEQADDLGWRLLGRGASPLYFPTIALAGPEDPAAVTAAVASLGSYHGLILTSGNAVERFLDAVLREGRDLRSLSGLRLLAVGSKTAEALAARGLAADAVPADFRAEGLIALLEAEGVAGKRFLLPRAEEGREILPERLRELGGQVDVVTVYRTLPASPDPGEMARWRRAGVIDAVTFTSGSTFRHFLAVLDREVGREVLEGTTVACIGPVVAAEVRQAGFEVQVVPPRATMEDLVAALESHFAQRS